MDIIRHCEHCFIVDFGSLELNKLNQRALFGRLISLGVRVTHSDIISQEYDERELRGKIVVGLVGNDSDEAIKQITESVAEHELCDADREVCEESQARIRSRVIVIEFVGVQAEPVRGTRSGRTFRWPGR